MKNIINRSQHVLSKHLGFFFFAVVLFWIKTIIAYQAEFNLGIDNGIQQFLSLVNPISSAIIFMGFALLAKGKRRFRALIGINLIMSFILYANIVYYRFFNDFITVPVLTQTKNFGDLGESVNALLHPYDPLYFLDTIILIMMVAFKVVKPGEILKKRTVSTVFAAGLILFAANLVIAEADRPQLLTRTFDRHYIVKYLGAYNYTIYDMIQSTKSSAQRALADSSDIAEVRNYTQAMYAAPNPEYFGKAEGMNVIYISLESLQSFIMDYQLNGQEVTPFLNSLTRDPNTLYFDNFFHQTGQGKTSDAEFIMDTSMFPLPKGSVYTTKAQNTYHALPTIIKSKGYTSAVFHGNYKTFWNRDVMYKTLGVDMFYDANYYSMTPENTLNYGLKDKPFFTESMPYLKELKQPFYSKFITLSNHFPYPLDEEDKTIEAATTGDKSVDQYFQTARYLDESIKQFFDDLKASGLYDNTMIVMYGDHYGISENHKRAMSEIMGKEITPYEQTHLQRVPLFIHMPGLKGGVNHTYGGQVDVLPTVLHLLGIDSKEYVQFGTDLLSKDHKTVVPFRNGDFVSPEVTFVDGKYYDTLSGELVEDEQAIKKYEELQQLSEKMLALSDKVVYGDLLRFYTPVGFKPVDPNTLHYTGPTGEE